MAKSSASSAGGDRAAAPEQRAEGNRGEDHGSGNALEHRAGTAGRYDCGDRAGRWREESTPAKSSHAAARWREVDRATIEAGIPGIILMENAAAARGGVYRRTFPPVSEQRIVVVCGKGNNGGDGLAIARQLHVRFNPAQSARRADLRTGGAERRRGPESRNAARVRACRSIAISVPRCGRRRW